MGSDVGGSELCSQGTFWLLVFVSLLGLISLVVLFASYLFVACLFCLCHSPVAEMSIAKRIDFLFTSGASLFVNKRINDSMTRGSNICYTSHWLLITI